MNEMQMRRLLDSVFDTKEKKDLMWTSLGLPTPLDDECVSSRTTSKRGIGRRRVRAPGETKAVIVSDRVLAYYLHCGEVFVTVASHTCKGGCINPRHMKVSM